MSASLSRVWSFRPSRNAAVLFVAGAAVALGLTVDLAVWNDGAVPVSWLVTQAAAIGLGVFVVAAMVRGLVGVAARRTIGPSLGVLAVGSLIAGFALAAPVELGWSDGCNSHSATVLLADAPRILITEPESIFAGYEDSSTLMNCG